MMLSIALSIGSVEFTLQVIDTLSQDNSNRPLVLPESCKSCFDKLGSINNDFELIIPTDKVRIVTVVDIFTYYSMILKNI